MSFIKTLAQLSRMDLPVAGGKGANLGALLKAGLPVPTGFCITTDGYRAFVAANHLDADLRQILDATRMDDPISLDTASDQIRASFRSGQIPPTLSAEIRQAYHTLYNQPPAVAVRSSATAEDLPDLSFAGQQDTYLNILGEESLLDAVMRCWGSLWTARAIGYRARNSIPHDNVALAVIVQQMVQSEVSGVLFTANPLTGKRSETVIDATFGLGEALVSGKVEPDHYVVDAAGGHILSKTLGAKALIIQGQTGGGTVTVEQDESRRQALTDEHILALTRLGQQAAAYFGTPQDLEWALADGQMYIVQSRPITSLYPLPKNVAAEPLEVMLFFGSWQGMLDPFTPLGQDIFSYIVSGISGLFNVKVKPEKQRVLLTAGDRLYINITGLLHNSVGRRVTDVFVSSFDPVSGRIIKELLADTRFKVTDGISLRTLLRLICGIWPFAQNVIFNLLFPRRGRMRIQRLIEKTYAELIEQFGGPLSLTELVTLIIDSSQGMIKTMMPPLVAGVASGQGISLEALTRMSSEVPQGPALVMDLTRGLSYNVTTEMDLALWETARVLRAEPEIADRFNIRDTVELVSDYNNGKLPQTAQSAIAHFLEKYGMRGVGEIDLGRPRWNEDPTPIFRVLKSYLQIDEAKSPDVFFRRGVEKARQSGNQLIAAIAATSGGRFKAMQARSMIQRFHELGGLRESPKFAIVQRMGIFRKALLASGHKLVEQGVLNKEDDVFFLQMSELKALGNGEKWEWQALIDERRAVYQRELRRKRSPRIMLSDGTAYYDAITAGVAEDENTLSGSPVSAGVVEGVVHVIFDPHEVQLVPGEILVCPATDPAWTPLFLSAGGLVMEVGGMMTHGSVVAREYGIPAVVGVSKATTRLKTGQRVRVDGSSGKVIII